MRKSKTDTGNNEIVNGRVYDPDALIYTSKNRVCVLTNPGVPWLLCLLCFSMAIPAFSQTRDQNEFMDKLVIPIGMDAYRMWSRLPQQRIGARAYMRSTYDRTGANESVDASHYLFANEENHNVSLDVKGRGVFYFFRANHWHGSPWHFIVDGEDLVVQETGTQDPVHAKKRFAKTTFIPSGPFPEPLAWTWGATKGADLIWIPMPFEESFRIAYSRTHYGTGYYVYKMYANPEHFSQSIQSWDMKKPDQDIVELIQRSGEDIAPKNIKKKSGKVTMNDDKVTLANINGAYTVRAFRLTLPLDKAVALERSRLQITWDDHEFPSIDAPLCLFFGAGTLYNRDNREYLVKGFPINIRYDYEKNIVELSCYYPMPFFESARIELTGGNLINTEISYEIRYEPNKIPRPLSSYFHATYKDMPNPELGKDLTFLDTRGIEGQQDWSGSFVGTSFIFSHNNFLGTLEGDPRFFFDDSQTPQAYGTGTEEWCGGGDYWGGNNMTLPFAGHPCGAPNKNETKNDLDMIQSAYRFLVADVMPFGNRAVIRFEHGGENLSSEHYETVTYWYGLPSPSLVKTDEIDVGNITDEKAHAYHSPEASDIEQITSRYEWGIDFFPERTWGMDPNKIPEYNSKRGKEIFPAQQKDGRYTQGFSEFEVELQPDNVGALIRRTLDYSFPNQTAEVYVADTGVPEGQVQWKKAGIWYVAGANTALYSDPGGELENRLHNTQTSNRRFRDDEFLIPAKLTKGKSRVRIKVKFLPNEQELFPGFPFPKGSALSELDYTVYSYVIPGIK